jgi:ribulose 1,5-bisphosphate synthetase/thiazole synthase
MTEVIQYPLFDEGLSSIATSHDISKQFKMTSENAKPRVLIVGAGLSGLTLAQCLRKRGISFEVFDRDTNISERQGWAIAVHS